MKIQRLAMVLTVINLLILISALSQVGPAAAKEAAPVLRGRGLEIVDDNGKLRAQIILYPASTSKAGEKYPDTVLLRLIDPNGRPGVKIGTSEDGSGMTLAGDSERRDWNGVQILAKAAGSTLKLTNKDGRQHLLKP